MSSPGQKRGSCGHAMAIKDGHSFCARCRDKGKGKDTCIETPTSDCKFCLLLAPEQKAQLATPSYKLKKEKRDAKKAELSSPSKDGTLVDPATVSVIGAVSDNPSISSPLDKKPKKDKPTTSKSKKSVEKSATDKKMEELDQKWSDRFNRLEALLMSKTFPPTVSSTVKVAPSHSPPATITKDNELFFQPTSSERTGQVFSAFISLPASSFHRPLLLQSALDRAPLLHCISQLRSDPQQQDSSPKRTVSDFSAAKHQSTIQLVSDQPRPDSSPKRTGSDSSAVKHQSSSQLSSDRH